MREGRRGEMTFDVAMKDIVAVHVMKAREELFCIAANMAWSEVLR
jgi:hypothetical protein